LVGDVLRESLSLEDKALTFILSDAGTATALAYDAHAAPSAMIVRSDGSGYGRLIIPAGGARKPLSEETRVVRECEDGNKRSEEHLFMDGKAVFTFAVKEIPRILTDVMALHAWNPDDVDAFLLHQANAYMLRYIAKRARIPLEKFPINIHRYGNTNGATIPFLICDLSEDLLREERNIVMAGFGVGLSWGAAAMRLGGLDCADVIHV
jgi:3-oxoacyl-[acyl-carrier-protein] synthase-3